MMSSIVNSNGASASVSARELLVWVSAFVFLAVGPVGASLERIWEVAAMRGLEVLGWLAVATNLYLAKGGERPGRTLIVLSGATALGALTLSSIAYAPLALLGCHLAFASPSPHLRAAGAVLLALACHKLFGPFAFWAFAEPIVRIDGWLTSLTFLGNQEVAVSGNVFIAPDGHGIEILAGCSAFHNLSLALLCWIAVTKIERPEWRRTDLVTLLIAIAVSISANLFRLHKMALSEPQYVYWHVGEGAAIVQNGLTAFIFVLCLAGAKLGSRQHA